MKETIIGYAIYSTKHKTIMRHAVRSNKDYFTMLIFDTLEEAKKYVMYGCEIRKVRMTINKKDFNVKWC